MPSKTTPNNTDVIVRVAHSPVLMVVIIARALLSLSLVGAAIFMFMQGLSILGGGLLPATDTAIIEFGSITITAQGIGGVIIVCSVVPFVFSYLCRPTLKVWPKSKSINEISSRLESSFA